MKKQFMARQGDVLLVQARKAVAGEPEAPDSDGLVLARGEVTGHRHFIVGKDAGEVVADRVRRQLTLQRTVMLEHEEHAPIQIPGGLTIDLPSQTEWTDAMEPRQVAD